MLHERCRWSFQRMQGDSSPCCSSSLCCTDADGTICYTLAKRWRTYGRDDSIWNDSWISRYVNMLLLTKVLHQPTSLAFCSLSLKLLLGHKSCNIAVQLVRNNDNTKGHDSDDTRPIICQLTMMAGVLMLFRYAVISLYENALLLNQLHCFGQELLEQLMDATLPYVLHPPIRTNTWIEKCSIRWTCSVSALRKRHLHTCSLAFQAVHMIQGFFSIPLWKLELKKNQINFFHLPVTIY